MPRILVTAPRLPEAAMDDLRAHGAELRMMPIPSPAADVEALMRAFDPEAVLSRTLSLTAAAIRAAPSLRVISKHGVGIDNIDLAAATSRRIPVLVCFGVNARPVAEHALALIFALARQVTRHDRALRAGGWTRFDLPANEIAGRTIGLVGFGQSARHLATMSAALGMEILAWSPRYSQGPAPAGVRPCGSLDELLATSDIVSLHCPLSDQTRGLIDAARIARMKPGAWLINVARGPIVDEAARFDALVRGHLGGAGLDTFTQEPLAATSPLRSLDNVVLTPHVAGSTVQSTERTGIAAVRNLLSFLDGTPIDPRILANPEALV